ncbi:hypothetical protein [Confluentibacter flavum]|uniref:Adhesin domain-containing protein n=1 Tax=Confluentibacter flavum TaxID=1909700 RepID=A0A2N3HIR6_9FLAO|nr:hypothetical protein [Confluentibacter flavum]PKQ44841.1 hypothetical protein CSW08_11040 [Confluentibacter flavum]
MNSKIMKQSLFVLSFFIVGSIMAQQKLTKLSQSIKVDNGVILNLNTSNCNIEFDTWNKNVVEIEAYIEGEKLSKEELEKALKAWGVSVDATSKEISITTKGNAPATWIQNDGHHVDVNAILDELKYNLAYAPEMNFNFDFDMPEVPEIPEMPELPELPEGINNIQFDYEAYKKDGEKYIEQWSKNFESKMGDDYAKKMEAWGEKFGKEWGEKYGKQMEAWGERFAAQMEARAERMEHLQEQREEQKKQVIIIREQRENEREKIANEREKLANERRMVVEKIINTGSNSNVKKTIKIRLPKDAKIKVDVKHGELKFVSNVDNLKANLSYTNFIANSINGSKTSINASYSPVNIAYWNVGELNLNFVKTAELKTVKRLVLTSNSSNVKIENVTDNAVINGSIGNLKILNVGDGFTNLNVNLQNSDAVISLPKVDYNFQYKGTRSRLKHPKKTSNDNVSTFSTNNSNTKKTIVVNAKYSNVVMQ